MPIVLGTQIQIHVPAINEPVGVILIVALEVLSLDPISILIVKCLIRLLGLSRAEHVGLMAGVVGRVFAYKLQDVELPLPFLAELLVVDGGLEVRQPVDESYIGSKILLFSS